jgi:PAS domain S-box-containing protein
MSPSSVDNTYLELAPDAVILVAADGTIEYANPRALVLFGSADGSTEVPMTGRSVDEFVPSESRSAHGALRSQYVENPTRRLMGSPASLLLARRADGSVFPCEIGLSPVSAPSEEPVTMAIVRDITSRRVAERQTQMIRSSLDAVDDGVLMFDDESLVIRYANHGAELQTGRPARDLIGEMTLLDLVPELGAGELRSLLAPVASGASDAVTVTASFANPNGDEMAVEMSIQHPPAAAHDGHGHYVAIARDITERRDAERYLRASEAGFRSAFTDAPVGMLITDPGVDGLPQILEANQEFCEMLGYAPGELQGRSVAEITHPEDQARSEQIAAWEGPGAAVVEKRFIHRTGQVRWCREHSADLNTVVGQRRRLAHVIDITRRVMAESARDHREDTLAALGDIRRRLLDEQTVPDALADITDAAVRLAGGESGHVLLPRHGGYELAAAATVREMPVEPVAQAVDCPLADRVLLGGRTLQTTEAELAADDLPFDVGPGAVIVAPLITRDAVEGVMVVTGVDPDQAHLLRRTVESLAGEAALAIQLARSRRERRRLTIVEDRDRIARDLHDVVIQRLFAAGMRLQSAASSGTNLRGRVIETVSELDETIGTIRDTIFRLTRSEPDLHDEIVMLAHGFESPAGHPIDIDVASDVALVSDRVGEQLLPTINELLSNAARHSNATSVALSVNHDDEGALVVVVSDDGDGVDEDEPKGFGIGNVTARAARLGGTVAIESRPGEGTRVTWRVPSRSSSPSVDK